MGDVVGRPGRQAVKALVPELRRELDLDVVICNGENAAAGRGLTEGTAREIFDAGVDVITSGNHIWDQKDSTALLDADTRIVRPLNYPKGVPGRGIAQYKGVTVVNIQGRTFMIDIDCPFRAMDAALSEMRSSSIIIVDFHAEATSEKVAMGRYLDGRVTAVIGTHTHVPTADPRILPAGAAYITDAGMVGPRESIIGNEIEDVLNRFLTGLPTRMPVALDSPTLQFNSVFVEVDERNGRALSIMRVDREWRVDDC